jgi:16S rRNA processing protein RimM
LSPEPSGDFITLARVVKTQGRRGEVAAEVHTPIPDRFALGMKLFALGAQDLRRELSIEDLWPHKSLLVLKFAGIDSISQAESLIGNELQVPRAERAKLKSGWTFVSDLIGCTVFDHGREIGPIEEVQFGAGEAPLLIVRGKDNRFDVPFAEAYVEGVDVGGRQVRLNLPDGLLEINAPLTPEEKQQQAKGLKGRGLKPRR